VLVLSFVASVAADPIKNAKGALCKADVATAMRLLLPLAEQGNASAQRELSLIYFGTYYRYPGSAGDIKDDRASLKWLRRAAEGGDVIAQGLLGSWYYHGMMGLPQNYHEAEKWLRRGAEQGDLLAQGYLGSMYYRGEGVTQDYSEAAKWLRPAAEQGWISAFAELADLYAKGYGVKQDYMLAHMWFNLATESAYNSSITANRDSAARLAALRDSVARIMTATQIAEAQRLAREWKSKKAPRVPRPVCSGGNFTLDNRRLSRGVPLVQQAYSGILAHDKVATSCQPTGGARSKNLRWISASGGVDPGFRFAPSRLFATCFARQLSLEPPQRRRCSTGCPPSATHTSVNGDEIAQGAVHRAWHPGAAKQQQSLPG